MTVEVFDPRVTELGEGPLWHPDRGQFFWFDILGMRLLTEGGKDWAFDEHVSAAGWVDRTRLMVASETALFLFDVDTGARESVCPLEAENPVTRSNDGRADPQGGFWIGTMGKSKEPEAGAIYRWYRGGLRKLYGNINVSNAICFAPSGDRAYFSDTDTHKIMTVGLDADGWPSGDPTVFLDLTSEAIRPDGAVVDAEGILWNAQFGAGRVAAYAPDGRFLKAIQIPAPNTTCPAFGGADLTDLYCTTATAGMDADALAKTPDAGKTFRIPGLTKGQAEHRVLL